MRIGGSEEPLFQSIKGVLFQFTPLPGGSFPSEIIERSSKMGVITDKLTIKTCETKESTDIFEFSGSRPIYNTPKFDGVHSKLASLKMDAEVFNLILLKFTFLWFQEKLI